MQSVRAVGRTIGLLMLVRVVLAPMVYFRLLPPATSSGFLATAAGNAVQVRLAVLLALVLGGLTLAIAIVVMPVLRRHSERMTFTFVALSAIGFATLAMDNVGILSMVSLSEQYANASAPDDLYQVLGQMARSEWRGAHYTNLIVGHVAALVFNLILYRAALVPRALAGFAVAAFYFRCQPWRSPYLGIGGISGSSFQPP
jgi:hypothetical protein